MAARYEGICVSTYVPLCLIVVVIGPTSVRHVQPSSRSLLTRVARVNGNAPIRSVGAIAQVTRLTVTARGHRPDGTFISDIRKGGACIAAVVAAFSEVKILGSREPHLNELGPAFAEYILRSNDVLGSILRRVLGVGEELIVETRFVGCAVIEGADICGTVKVRWCQEAM